MCGVRHEACVCCVLVIQYRSTVWFRQLPQFYTELILGCHPNRMTPVSLLTFLFMSLHFPHVNWCCAHSRTLSGNCLQLKIVTIRTNNTNVQCFVRSEQWQQGFRSDCSFCNISHFAKRFWNVNLFQTKYLKHNMNKKFCVNWNKGFNYPFQSSNPNLVRNIHMISCSW